jgi:hypothetical protein
MRVVSRICFALFFLAGLALAPKLVLAQAGAPNSDLLQEFITDHNAPAATPDVPMLPGFPPIVSIEIPEVSPEGTAQVFTMPGRVIDFREGASTAPISDRLSFNQYQVGVVSDEEVGLPPRANAIQIPASALEAFLPISISAFSDGDQVAAAQPESDHLTITIGYHGRGTGDVTEFPIPEPVWVGDGTEPIFSHVIPGLSFDIVEPGAVPGTTQGIISDYVDISEIGVTFISSDDQAIYSQFSPAHGFVIEDHLLGGSVTYSLGFVSDTNVPEPTSITLLCIGLVSAGLLRRPYRGK